VEQLFDSREVNVSKNGVFAEELAHNIREWVTELETRVGQFELDNFCAFKTFIAYNTF
jgi:hypothetical protein